MTVALLVIGLVVGGTSPGWADTRTGSANPTTTQFWGFFNGGTGETKVTLSWTKSNAYLFMLLVCGDTEPLVYGAAASGLNRYAEITAGVPPNSSCTVGVSSMRGRSGYRIHLNQTVSEVSRPEGRHQRLSTASDGDLLGWYAQMELDRLRLQLEP